MHTATAEVDQAVSDLMRRARRAQQVAEGYGQARVDELVAAAVETAGKIAANAPLSVRNIRRVVRDTAVLTGAEAIAVELAAYDELTPTDDRREGVAAWGEKRKADWKGR